MRIGYLGPEGTWSHQAALSRFGDSVELVPYASFDHVFSAVEHLRPAAILQGEGKWRRGIFQHSYESLLFFMISRISHF